MTYFKFILFTIFLLECNGKLSNQRLCGDPKCTVPVSTAKTLIRYASPANHILSFQPNVEAMVYSKNAAATDDLWGIEINGKRGYAPKSLLRENRILVKQLDLVSTEMDISDIKETSQLHEIKIDATANSRSFPAMGVSAENMATDSPLLPTEMLPSYEIVDGTTLFNNPIAAEHTIPSNPSATTKSMHTQPHSDPAKTTPTVPNIQPSSGEAPKTHMDTVDIAREKVEENEAGTKSEEDKSDVTESEENKSDEEEEEMEEGEEEAEEGEEGEEEEEDGVVVEEEGSTARGIYRYISGLLTGEGSGSHTNEKIEKINMPSNEDASIKEKEHTEHNKDVGRQGKKEVEPHEAAVIDEKDLGGLKTDEGIQEKEQGELNRDAVIIENDQVLLNIDPGIQEKEQNVLDIESGIREKIEVLLNTDEGVRDKEQGELNKDAASQEHDQVVLNKDVGIQENEPSVLNIEAGIQEKEQIMLNQDAGIQGKEKDTLSNFDGKNTEQLTIQPDIVNIISETDSLQTELKDLNTEAEKTFLPLGGESIISTDNDQKQKELNQMQEKINLAASVGLEIEKQELSETEGTIKVNIGDSDAAVSSLPEGEVLQTMPEQSVPHKVDSLVGSLTYDRTKKADETLYNWGANPAQPVFDSQNHNTYGDKTVEKIADIGQHEQQFQKDDATHSTFDTLKASSESSSEIYGNLDLSVLPFAGSKGADVETNTDSQADLDGPSLAPHAEVTSEIPTVADVDYSELKSINDTPIHHDHDKSVLGENVAEHENISESQESIEYNSSRETTEYNNPNDLQQIDNTTPNLNANPEFTESEADKELTDNTLIPVEQVPVSVGETGTSHPDSESERVTTETVDDGSIPDIDTEDTGVMTYVSSFFSGVTSLFTSSKVEDNDQENQKSLEEDTEHREAIDMASGNLDHDHPSCSADGIADCANMLPTATPDALVSPSLPVEPTVQTQFIEELDHLPSGEMTVYLVVTAITVLLFSLGHFFIEKSKQDAALVRKINSLEKSLLVSAKECALVTNELQATIERDTPDNGKDSAAVAYLSEELEEKKRECAELEDQVANLQSELDAATDAGMDLNRMLTEFLSTQHSTNALMESVEQMQEQLNSQQGTIDSTDALLNAKSIENENLQGELYVAMDKIESLERDLNKATVSLSELLVGKAKQDEGIGKERLELQHQVTELLEKRQAETDNFSAEITLLQSQVAQLKESLAAKERELSATQECIARLSESSEFEGSNKVQDVVDVGKARAELGAVKAQRDAVVDELKEERGAKKFLDDHVKVISEEVEILRDACRLAEEQRTEAIMKLKVLSSYFEEKEMQLQKDLDMQEAISVRTTGDMSSTCELVGSLQEQMKSYRSQNETLKKEILDQERELKDQIAALEKKAHENWVSARQAERKVEEMKQEAGQLRNLLTIAEKPSSKLNQSSDQAAVNDRLSMDVNGELPTSPLHVGMGLGGLGELPLPYPPIMSPPTIAYPPPHLGGVPFMPPPTYSFDRRPPPLGCMSSPPLLPPPPPTARHYTRHYEQHSPDRLSPDKGFRSSARGMPSSGPASGPAGFRPFPRTSKGSNLSSDHSSGSLEK